MSFKQVFGQDKVIKFLSASIKNNRLASSYLFIGPEGLGKCLVARNFAKTLNCEKDMLDACDSCISCNKIDTDNHPDIHWIEKDNSGSIKIDCIRKLETDINLKPYEAKKKVFIIKDAHAMTPEAANALLKTLEEPPKDSILILTTYSQEKIFPTVVSRCQKIFFSSMNMEKLEFILKNDYNLKEAISHYLSHFTEGRLGAALRLKDKDVLNERNRIIDNFASSREQTQDYFNLEFQNKQEIGKNLDILISWFRDILLLQCGVDATNLINADRGKELGHLKDRYKIEDTLEIIQQIFNSYTMLEYNLNPKIFLEFLRTKAWVK